MTIRFIFLTIIACLLTIVAQAETKHVKFTTEVVIDGQPVINEVKCPMLPAVQATATTPAIVAHRDCQIPFTVGEMVYISLERPVGGQPQSWTDAIKHDDLAHAVRNAEDFPLLDEQRISIEAAMAASPYFGSPAILGFVARVIDPPIMPNVVMTPAK